MRYQQQHFLACLCVLCLVFGVQSRVRSKRQGDVTVDKSKDHLTQAERIEILTAHNRYRSSVNPTATNMLFMVSTYTQLRSQYPQTAI